MSRNEEMAAVLRGAARGAEPWSDWNPSNSDGVHFSPTMHASDVEACRMTARILRAMATVYETAAKAESLAP